MAKHINIEVYRIDDHINLRSVDGGIVACMGELIVIMDNKAYAKSHKEKDENKDVYVELLDLADTIRVNAPGIFSKIS